MPPPPRQPRAGARPGALSPDLRRALRAEATRLSSLDDPEARIRAVSDTFAALDPEIARIAQVRYRAILALRVQGGWSYDRLSAASGLSKSPVAQLCQALEHD